MDDMDQELEIERYKQIKTSDIAKNLGIAESTVRKYCQLLEDKGYVFRRDSVGARIYTGADESAVNELRRLSKEMKMGVEMAANVVATRRKDLNEPVSPTQNVQPAVEKDGLLTPGEMTQFELQYLKAEMDTIKEIAAGSMTKKQGDFLIEKVEQLLEDNAKLREEKEETERENKIFKEKVDLVVEYIQQEKEEKEKNIQEEKEEKEKNIFQRWLEKVKA